MSKDPIKLTIGLGFTGVLALMGLISFISLSQMNTVTDQMSALLIETNTKLSAANAMRDSIRLRGDTIYDMSRTDDFIERDRLRLLLSEHGLRYRIARDTLYTYHMSSREAKLLDQLMVKTRRAKGLNDIVVDKLLSDMAGDSIEQDLKLADDARRQMLIGLDNLVQLQEDIATSVVIDARKYQESISSIILLLSLAAFFIALYIAQLVVRETSRKNYEIRFQATHDELTRLVNRKEFNKRLHKALNTAVDHRETHALCFMDLDKFKVINDTCGHKAGDELLVQLTSLIQNSIRSRDTLARLGGDEFGLLLEGCTLEKAVEIAEGIVSLIKNYEFDWQDKTFHVGASIGLVMITHDTRNIDNALSQADIACYAAKDMGRGQVHVHGLDDDHARMLNKELSWVAEINNSASDGRFSLYLQAIENLQRDKPATMYEVLLRLNDDDGTLILPVSYIPASERFGLMKDVDRWVIENSLRHLSALYKTIPGCDVQLSINLSANSMADPEFADFVISRLHQHKIAHDAVCLEISVANAEKNIEQAINIISRLREHDVKFALDDFGHGSLSVSQLKELRVDYLKINGSVIKDISHSTADKAMVAAISQIGRVMHIETIAKHVENVFVMNKLKDMGIDYAQGFYLDKPADIESRFESRKSSLQLSKKH